MPSMFYRIPLTLIAAVASMLALGCSTSETTGGTTTKLEADCRQDILELEDEDWLCGEDLTVECEDGGADPGYIYLVPSGEPPASCDEIELSLNHEGPFEVGTHEIVVTANIDEESIEACESTLTVEDNLPPEANEEPIELWPPNHKFHTISGEDCVRDACDGSVRVTFHSASSDEPVNGKGDGNTEPDIILECDRVQLRSERQGGSNGRVYKLGWKAVDDSGNATHGECVVNVHHDQSGRKAVADEPAYEITLDAEECDDGAGGAGGDGGMAGSGGMGGMGMGGSGGMAGRGGMGG